MIENIDVESDGPAREPEHTLMIKVLKQAVEDYQHPKGTYRKRTRLTREAKQWFNQPDNTSWPLSFVNICEALDLNPQAVRDRLSITT